MRRPACGVRSLLVLLVMAAGARSSAAQILDVRELRPQQIAALDRARRAADSALKVLDGAPDAALPRVPAEGLPAFDAIVRGSLEHEREVEQRETGWLLRVRR